MLLKTIKLSGFKSFVDPTTISLMDSGDKHSASHLTAIVGPNGCGKSNIIDAISWVLGENSPKYLRGESATDVIFNGAAGRKPVGQASVELVFDNSDGTLGGEYGSYAEISVKRLIDRDRDSGSRYFLNGGPCRKYDVTSLLLGTGLGPRSCSIIGQNMITEITVAKPEELRKHIEEAAGTSKYKERRRETELRINHTKENLARVNDLQLELEKQLSHLKHQASVAEKFKTLKQQERVLRAELYALQWRILDSKLVEATLQIQREETALEARNSEITHTEREIEQARHEQRVAQDVFQEVQRRYYAVGNEITRIEQDILHHQERQQQWETDLQQADSDCELIKEQMAELEDNLSEIEHEIQTVEPQLVSITREVETIQAQLNENEEQVQNWQAAWDEFNQMAAQVAQTAQVEKTRIEHLEQRIASLQKRKEQLSQEQNQINFTDLQSELENFSKESFTASEMLETQEQKLTEIRDEIASLQKQQQTAEAQLNQARSELQQLRGQQASLEALQQTALGQRDQASAKWAEQQQLHRNPRLAQQIEVDQGWELALEKVLGNALQAICVEHWDEAINKLSELNNANLCLVNSKKGSVASTKHNHTTLLSKIQSTLPLSSLLDGIYVADSLEEALRLAHSLNQTESVITRDGIWLGAAWIKVMRESDPAAGVFQREQELKQIAGRVEALQEVQQTLEEQIEQQRHELHDLEHQREQIQQAYTQLQARSAQISTQCKMKQERMNEIKARAERLTAELTECTAQWQQAQQEFTQARALWEKALAELELQTAKREELIKERDQARQQLQTTRHVLNEQKERMHELQIRAQTAKSQKGSLQQAMTRAKSQLNSLSERKISLQSELSSIPPIDTLQKSLSRSLDKHVAIEAELNTARISLETLEQEFKNLENKRSTIDRDINRVRSQLEVLRVDWQGWKVKAETICEQIKETEFKLEDVLKELPQDITAEEWQAKLEQVVQRINRLGAINLVAIEEYATCQERKQYLDKQLEDLQAALTTLEEAIAKIDKETQTRFKEAYDQINQRFQELFPTIFGGGKAYLELTSDNLLEAGVTMMACPPGKRNSSIHLLSGGEKSLTALAFIFSVFHLNPAPFCLLDEVDAALDDANVLRFTRLVKSMADKTQFLFISHNKIAIEMGQQLIGVTMQEPGVSRLVSVDIDKAITMVDS